MNKIIKIILFIVSFFILLYAHASSVNAADEYAIAAGIDKKIYIVDLNTNEILYESDEFKDIGNPTSIDFNKRTARLYVGSERGDWQMVYEPLIAISINGSFIKLAEKLPLEEYEISKSGLGNMSAVYMVRVSPDGEKLYLGYAHPKYASEGSAIYDLTSNKIIGTLSFYVREYYYYSDDGRYLYGIWPGGSKKVRKNGKEELQEWQGGVATYDLQENKKIGKEEGDKLIASGRGLNPPGKQLAYPLMRVREKDGQPNKSLVAFSRSSGKKLWETDIPDGIAIKDAPVVFSNNKKALIPVSTGNIFVVDIKRGAIISEIKIGTITTNVVVVKGKDIGIKKNNKQQK